MLGSPVWHEASVNFFSLCSCRALLFPQEVTQRPYEPHMELVRRQCVFACISEYVRLYQPLQGKTLLLRLAKWVEEPPRQHVCKDHPRHS